MKTQKFNISTAESRINWVGKKVTGSHNGTINLKSGQLTLNDGQITAGEFIVDTRSIKILDITDPATNAQFAGHLASEDFFNSEKYPEASLIISSSNHDSCTADLTIKGITQEVTFNIDAIVNDQTLAAKASVVIDRTKYDMKFRSGNFFQNLGDTLIYNEFELTISLTAIANESTAVA